MSAKFRQGFFHCKCCASMWLPCWSMEKCRSNMSGQAGQTSFNTGVSGVYPKKICSIEKKKVMMNDDQCILVAFPFRQIMTSTYGGVLRLRVPSNHPRLAISPHGFGPSSQVRSSIPLSRWIKSHPQKWLQMRPLRFVVRHQGFAGDDHLHHAFLTEQCEVHILMIIVNNCMF